MMNTASSAPPASRPRLFFQGFFLPVLLWAAVFSVWPLTGRIFDREILGVFMVLQTATVAVLIGGVLMLSRWWRPARWRAYGVIGGLLALPLFLVAALVIAVTQLGLQIGPK
jgi:hypothetical protein